MSYEREIAAALKDIAQDIRIIRKTLQRENKAPRVAHWIIDAKTGEEAYCSACGNAVSVENADAFCEFLTERPLMCQKCRAIMCEEVTLE